MRVHRDRHRSLQPLPPWITQCLCHQSSSATSVPSCCPCLGRTGQVSVLLKVTCHHHHPLTHHCSSHHGGDRPTPSPGEGSCYASHREVKAARSKFCPQTSSSDQGCVHKNQDNSSNHAQMGQVTQSYLWVTDQRSLLNSPSQASGLTSSSSKRQHVPVSQQQDGECRDSCNNL